MTSEDQDKAQPSLEVPRLFGRRPRKTRPATPATPAPAADAAVAAEAPGTAEPVTAEPAVQERLDETVVPPVDEPTEVLEPAEPVRETVPAAPPPSLAPAPLFVDEVAPTPPAATPPAAEPEPRPRRELPAISGRVAAAVTGLLTGLALVGATVGALQGCEAVQGTSSCGRAGFPLLLAIFVAVVVAGSALLRLLRVPDPTSTSFLAVGLVAVVALLFFIDVIDQWWMVIAIPAVSVATFLLSHWVTTTFIEPAED